MHPNGGSSPLGAELLISVFVPTAEKKGALSPRAGGDDRAGERPASASCQDIKHTTKALRSRLGLITFYNYDYFFFPPPSLHWDPELIRKGPNMNDKLSFWFSFFFSVMQVKWRNSYVQDKFWHFCNHSVFEKRSQMPQTEKLKPQTLMTVVSRLLKRHDQCAFYSACFKQTADRFYRNTSSLV